MPDRRWLPFLVMALVIGALIRSQALLTFAITLLVVVGVVGWWRRHALDGVKYERRLRFRRLFPGETTRLQIDVENKKFLPLSWLKIADPWPRAVGPQDDALLAPSHIPSQGFLTNVFSLRWFERAHREYTLKFRQRGLYTVGPAQAESGDLFGISETHAELGSKEYLTVFPETLPLASLRLDAEDPFGGRRSRRRLFEDPNLPVGVREYRPEDELRRVHWPATARTGSLQVKMYQPVSAQVMMVCLNVSTFPHYWEGVYPDLLEQLIKVAATLVYHGVEEGYSVGLVSNGSLAQADQPFRLQPSRSPHQMAHLLGALAGVTPFSTAPFETFLYRSVPGMPYGATLVIVTAILSPELVETLTRLRRYRLHTILFSLAKDAPPDIPGVRVIHLPFQDAS